MNEIERLLTLKIACFDCGYIHSCKYYADTLWDTWMFSHPEDGCPALKYPFDALYRTVLNSRHCWNGNRK